MPEPRPNKQTVRPRRRRPSGKAALVATSVVLVLAGVLASVQWLGDGVGAVAKSGDKPTATASTFAGWARNPVPEAAGSAQCSYGATQLLCAQQGVVFALDPADGALLWRHSVAESKPSKPPAVVGGLVQPMVDEGRRLEALDPASGKARWRRTLPAHHGMQLAGGTLLLTLLDGTVTGVDAATGDTRWSRRVPEQPMPTFVSFAGDPLAYATNLSADASTTQVTAVDPATGDVRWEARLSGNVTPVGVHDGSVFFLSTNEVYGDTDAVVRYTPASRSTRRVKLPVARPDAQATVHGNTVYVLATSGALDAVDTETGKRLWNLETSVSRGSVPVADSRHVYFTTADGRLLAVETDNGRLVGQTPARLGSNSGTVAAALPRPVLADDHHVYATAPDGTVFAVDARRPQDW